ncbi:hypothetical protein B0H14DRAFT_3719115 [Mycena olivaceomarginata]|nr:hypothetical protein B0H14DRAFT_3719115 [Mycena olivaceomarginata]
MSSKKQRASTPSGPGAALKSTPHGGSSDFFRPRSQGPAMNFGPVATLLTFLVLSCIISPCRAQTNKIFQWQFAGNALSSSLPSCRQFQIQVKPFNPANNTHGVPPFYMMAFAISGTPSTTLIGTDETNLSWTVNQPAPSFCCRLLTRKTPSPPASPGGSRLRAVPPPYDLTLAAVNSPLVINVTMGPADDQFTFIDRADPNTQLIAAISDLNGRWAVGTPIVKTNGSSNVDCIGLVSSSGNSTVIAAQEKAASVTSKAVLATSSAVSSNAPLPTSNACKKTAGDAGVVFTFVVLLLAAVFTT